MATIHCPTVADLTTALASAVAGDILTLSAGVEYAGPNIVTITLPDKGTLASPIIITTNSPASNFPADGYRIKKEHLPFMPVVRGPQHPQYNTTPAVRWAPGARDYQFKRICFKSNYYGNGNIIEYGRNDPSQNLYTQLPDKAVFDQCIVMGDDIWGQKRGIDINGREIIIKNSHLENIWGIGQDTMAIGAINGVGPVSIINNYIEASSYPVLFGGGDGSIKNAATVAAVPAPTVSTARLSSTAQMVVGQWIAILVNGGLNRRHSTVRTINTGTGDITFDAIDVIPDAPGDVRWGNQFDGITVRRNHITKRLSWQDPILDTPINVTAVENTAGGALAAGTWTYRITAVRTGSYQNITLYSPASPGVQVILDATGQVVIEWDAVTNASKYRVWRVANDLTAVYFETTGLTFTDTGGAGTAGTISGGTRTIVKCLFELKTGLNMQFDSNILEYSWRGSDIGQTIWLKTSNPGGTIEFNRTGNLVLEKNIIRHCAGVFNILGIDINSTRTPADYTRPTDTVLIRNNLIYDSQDPWCEGMNVIGIHMSGVQNLTFDHNTILHQKFFTFVPDFGKNLYLTNLTLRNNLFKKNSGGVRGANQPSTSEGTSSLQAHTNGTYVFERNAVGGGTASIYPPNNFFPTNVEFEAAFVDYDGAVDGDYHLKSTIEGDIFRGKGTDGKDLGCDMDLVIAATTGVIEGLPEGEIVEPPDPGEEEPGGTLLMFSAVHHQPPSADYAEVDIRNNHTVLAFDPNIIQTAYFSGVMPRFYAGQSIKIIVIWASESETNVANTVTWEAAFDRFAAGGQSIDSVTEGIGKTVVGVPNATPGVLSYSTITFGPNEIDGVQAGEAFRLRLSRLTNHVSDISSSDAQVLRVHMETVEGT